METVISELGGSWFHFLFGLPLDGVTFLFLWTLSRHSVEYHLAGQASTRYLISTISSGTLFVLYYFGVRGLFLSSIAVAIAYCVLVYLLIILLPVAFEEDYNYFRLRVNSAARRVAGTVFAFIVLLVSSPWFVLFTLAIKLRIPGTVFVRTLGISRSGRSVILYNFRTQSIHELAERPAFLLSSLSDPPLRWPGTFLTKSGLHNLPRLWNVFKGEISLIGVFPLDRREAFSEFGRVLLRNDSASVSAFYPLGDPEAHETIDYTLPLGLITYAELQAYHVRPWQRTVIRDRDLRVMILKEAEYFTRTPMGSTKLFVRFLVKSLFRTLSSLRLFKLEEARGPKYESEE